MKKDTFYFPHDFNARSDPKLIKLAMAGRDFVGLYWPLIELMHEQGGSLPNDPDAIAYALRSDKKRIAELINFPGLFITKGDQFTSKRVIENIEMRLEKSKKAKGSASKRWAGVQRQSEGNTRKEKDSTEDDITGDDITGEDITGEDIKDDDSTGEETNIKVNISPAPDGAVNTENGQSGVLPEKEVSGNTNQDGGGSGTPGDDSSAESRASRQSLKGDHQKSPAKKPPTEAESLLGYYKSAFKVAQGGAYVSRNFKQDCAGFELLIAEKYSVEEVKARIDKFFASNDSFILKSDYKIPLFVTKFHALGNIQKKSEGILAESERIRAERKRVKEEAKQKEVKS